MICRNGQFLLIDATCKTNRFGMMLILVVGVSQVMTSVLLAVGLLAKENIELYTWLLTQARVAVGQSTITHGTAYVFVCASCRIGTVTMHLEYAGDGLLCIHILCMCVSFAMYSAVNDAAFGMVLCVLSCILL